LKRDQVIEEESRIDQIARIISDPIVAYVQGFDMVITDGMDGADWDYFEWWKVRRSYMRCAPERFWKYSVRDAFIYGEKDGHFARMICEGPLI